MVRFWPSFLDCPRDVFCKVRGDTDLTDNCYAQYERWVVTYSNVFPPIVSVVRIEVQAFLGKAHYRSITQVRSANANLNSYKLQTTMAAERTHKMTMMLTVHMS